MDSKVGHELLEATLRELFQAEESATRHPRVEASRLGAAPPAAVMDAIALHAESQKEALDRISRTHGLTPAQGAMAIGRALSSFRDNLTDLTTTTEQSYRLTMLGVRHGIDLVRVLQEIARATGDSDLETWSSAWLSRRVGLVERAESELRWFVENPRRALEPVRSTPLAVFARSALRALGKMDTATGTASRH